MPSCGPPRSSSARGGLLGKTLDGLSESDVRGALERLDPLWDELFPAEQARIVQLLVERVTSAPKALTSDCGRRGLQASSPT